MSPSKKTSPKKSASKKDPRHFWMKLSISVLAFSFGLVLLQGLKGSRDEANVLDLDSIQSPDESNPEEELYSLNIEDSPVKGDPSAPVTMVVFSDLECPVCARFDLEVLKPLQPLIDEGKLKLIFKHFPIKSVHPYAELFAEGAECVRSFNGDEGFWAFQNKVFEKQSEWSQAASYGDALKLMEAYVDEYNFTYNIMQCVEKHEEQSTIADDLVYASELNLEGAPTYFINGRLFLGRPLDIEWEQWYDFVYGIIQEEYAKIPVTTN